MARIKADAVDDAPADVDLDDDIEDENAPEEGEPVDGDGDDLAATDEAVDAIVDDTPSIPAPITPQSTPQAHEARVLFENAVNEGAEAFASFARHAYIDAALAGNTVEIVVISADDGGE